MFGMYIMCYHRDEVVGRAVGVEHLECLAEGYVADGEGAGEAGGHPVPAGSAGVARTPELRLDIVK